MPTMSTAQLCDGCAPAPLNRMAPPVRGGVADGVNTFKGVPYAATPFGANQLRPPQPVEHRSGGRDALTYGPKPPQLPYLPP